MSNIAEKKVRELGYGTDPLYRNEYSANDVFEAAVECYDQATQDFLEKAEEYLRRNYPYVFSAYNIEQFKNYIKEEQ